MIARAAGIATLVFGLMLIEAARAARNERRQRARGGIEPRGDVYAIMTVVYPACFLSMIVEMLVTGDDPGGIALALGLVIFLLGKMLKWWAILSLGECWTFRVLVVPGMRLVAGGPYRYLQHPNYVAVVGELVGAALMTGARIAGPVATAAFCVLLVLRIRVERRALDAILRPS